MKQRGNIRTDISYTGSYDLAILKNPIADETGVKTFYEVNLEAATRTEEFNLVGGWSEISYLEHLAGRITGEDKARLSRLLLLLRSQATGPGTRCGVSSILTLNATRGSSPGRAYSFFRPPDANQSWIFWTA